MKLLISKWKELREVGPQAQRIIFNNLRTLIFHPLHFPSKALFTLTWWDHARHKFCVQAVNGWCLCVVERPLADVFIHLVIKIFFKSLLHQQGDDLSRKSFDMFLRGVWLSEAILGHVCYICSLILWHHLWHTDTFAPLWLWFWAHNVITQFCFLQKKIVWTVDKWSAEPFLRKTNQQTIRIYGLFSDK